MSMILQVYSLLTTVASFARGWSMEMVSFHTTLNFLSQLWFPYRHQIAEQWQPQRHDHIIRHDCTDWCLLFSARTTVTSQFNFQVQSDCRWSATPSLTAGMSQRFTSWWRTAKVLLFTFFVKLFTDWWFYQHTEPNLKTVANLYAKS